MSKSKRVGAKEKEKNVLKWKVGEISIRAASQEVGMDPETIRGWIARYEAEGADGFLPRRQNRVCPPEMKRQAVREYLSGAGSLMEISKKYHLRSKTQRQDWIKVYNAHRDFNSVKHSGGGSYMKQGREMTLEERIQIVKDCIAGGKTTVRWL